VGVYLENLILLEGIMGSSQKTEMCVAAEWEMTIGNIRYRVRSVFADKIKLGDALKNIAVKKQKNSSLPQAG
jgi:hypothetical protein